MSAAYEPVGGSSDGEDDEGHSVASSIEEPPFALDSHVPGIGIDSVETLMKHGSRILPPETTPVAGSNSALSASHAMSSITADGPATSMLQSSATNSCSSAPPHTNHRLRPNSSSTGVRQVVSQHSHNNDDGMETLVFEDSGSLMATSEPMLFGSSSRLPGSSVGMLWTHDSTTTTTTHRQSATAGMGSLDFSQLMRQADDRNNQSTMGTTTQYSRMPILQESCEEIVPGLEASSDQSPTSTTNTSSNLTPRTTMNNHSEHQQQYHDHNWLYSLFFCGPSHHTHSAVPMMSLTTPPPSHGDEGRHHTMLSSSTIRNNYSNGRIIQTTRLGETTFQVSMEIDPPSTARHVMDVLGNPDLLRLWCDPIRAMVVTKSSEGSQTHTTTSTTSTAAPSTNHPRGGDNNRQYEGEWIEATTSTLVSPSKHNSCLYSLSHMIYTSLGFPNYGKITLFVERLRGQVGLTIGPFAGGVMASHTITVKDDGPVVSVVDTVRLCRDEEQCVCCCGLCEPIKRCFMPRMAGHIEQTVSSMTRLRVLVEHGEIDVYATDAGGVCYDETQNSSMDIPLLS